MKVEVTNHALERYIQRCGLLVADPEGAIVESVLLASILRERTETGHAVAKGGGPGAGLRFVLDDSRPGKVVVVTVLPAADALEEGDQVLAAVEDFQAEAAATLARLVEEEARLRNNALRAARVAGALQAAHARVLRAIKELS